MSPRNLITNHSSKFQANFSRCVRNAAVVTTLLLIREKTVSMLRMFKHSGRMYRDSDYTMVIIIVH